MNCTGSKILMCLMGVAVVVFGFTFASCYIYSTCYIRP